MHILEGMGAGGPDSKEHAADYGSELERAARLGAGGLDFSAATFGKLDRLLERGGVERAIDTDMASALIWYVGEYARRP